MHGMDPEFFLATGELTPSSHVGLLTGKQPPDDGIKKEDCGGGCDALRCHGESRRPAPARLKKQVWSDDE